MKYILQDLKSFNCGITILLLIFINFKLKDFKYKSIKVFEINNLSMKNEIS